MSNRLALFTFNAHTSDTKVLTQEMQSLLQPHLQKLKQYIIVKEKEGTPQEHIHLLFYREYPDYSKQKIQQFIENTGIKKFIKRLPETNTIYNEKSFNYLPIKNTTEDHMHYVGYVCKEADSRIVSKGFTQDYITKCVNYYYAEKRAEAPKIDNSWKHLKPNELHAYIEHFSEKLDIPMDDPTLIIEMIKNKISFNQITERQMRKSKQELWIAHKDKVHHTSHTVAIKDLENDIHEDDWQYWKQRAIDFEEKYQKLKTQLKQ